MALEDIDVQRDIVDLKFISYSELLTDNFTYSMEIKEWTKDKFDIQMNFSDPLLLSRGDKLDKIVAKIKNYDFFVSLDGQKLKPEHSRKVKKIPV